MKRVEPWVVPVGTLFLAVFLSALSGSNAILAFRPAQATTGHGCGVAQQRTAEFQSVTLRATATAAHPGGATADLSFTRATPALQLKTAGDRPRIFKHSS